MSISIDHIRNLTGNQLGVFDVPCIWCGPERCSPANRKRKVLRVWRLDPGYASFHCARCGEAGHTHDRDAAPPNRERLAEARRQAAERERLAAIERLGKAQWLWSTKKPIAGTAAETYLREARGYSGPIPSTIGYLPGRGAHGPAMISAFGIPAELEPGILAIAPAQVTGVHLTRLAPDGRGKAGTSADKIMIGRSLGSPIVLAPVNDLLGLAVAEGIEDALTVHEATGLGAWAAGSASRLPALADAMPAYVECLSIVVDNDPAGRRHAAKLAELVKRRGIEVRPIMLPQTNMGGTSPENSGHVAA